MEFLKQPQHFRLAIMKVVQVMNSRLKANRDRAHSTGAQWLAQGVGNGNDEGCAGILNFYAPSSTTYVKNFYSRFQNYHGSGDGLSQDWHIAGYITTTSAVDAIKFIMSSGTIDAGTIKLYGVT